MTDLCDVRELIGYDPETGLLTFRQWIDGKMTANVVKKPESIPVVSWGPLTVEWPTNDD